MNDTLNPKDVVEYLIENPVVILGTIDEKKHPYGAAVYACTFNGDKIYIITKSETKKYQNLLANPEVSITGVNAMENSSIQAVGTAEIVESQDVIGRVMTRMTEVYAEAADWLPPITKFRAGPYEVIEITLTHVRLARFGGAKAGSEHIFSER